jgi:hypothetical protein
MVRAKEAEWTGNQPCIQLCRKQYERHGLSCSVGGKVIFAYASAKKSGLRNEFTKTIDLLPMVETTNPPPAAG